MNNECNNYYRNNKMYIFLIGETVYSPLYLVLRRSVWAAAWRRPASWRRCASAPPARAACWRSPRARAARATSRTSTRTPPLSSLSPAGYRSYYYYPLYRYVDKIRHENFGILSSFVTLCHIFGDPPIGITSQMIHPPNVHDMTISIFLYFKCLVYIV